MKDYEVKIESCTKELTHKERVAIKNFADCLQLDELTQEKSDGVVIDIDFMVQFSVHNEKSDNKDYTKLVIVAKDGKKYITGSDTLQREVESMIEEMDGCNEEWGIKVIRKPSKNFKGGEFLTCVIV